MTLFQGVAQVTEWHTETGVGHIEPWAVVELGKAWLGDPRRTARLVSLAMSLAEHPALPLPEACGNWAATKGAYRFFSNEDSEPDDILAAHQESTVGRIGQHSMILAVQDTTVYNFTTHRATRGQGPISGKKKGYTKAPTGFLVHSCLAVSPEGVPLGKRQILTTYEAAPSPETIFPERCKGGWSAWREKGWMNSGSRG